MGKYNFNYEKLNALEKENAALRASNEKLRASNEQLCARLDKVEELLGKGRQNGRRLIPPHLDHEKYAELFGLEITAAGELRRSSSLTQMSNWFAAFRQNIMRTILPAVGRCGRKNDGYKLICRELESLTKDEFEIVIETFQSVTDLLFYANNKLNKLADNSNNDLQED